MKTSLSSIELINVTDASGLEYFGCNQEWFGTFWQRLSGCGPSVAATLLLYLQRRGALDLPISGYDKKDCTLFMEQVWTHVTPTLQGVNTAELFCDGILSFAAANGVPLSCERLILPKKAEERPALADAVAFIEAGLNNDSPVAFLNLHNGKVKALEAWHWVTIVALETDPLTSAATVTIFDGDKADRVDFTVWYETTKKGGALVYLRSGTKTHAD